MGPDSGIAIETTPPAPSQRAALQSGLEDQQWYPATGRDLLALVEGCEEAACMSFVAGAVSGLSTRAFLFGQDNPFCAGDFVSTQDIRDALVTVIKADESLLPMPSTFAILATFSATWPCETQTQAAETAGLEDPVAFSLADMTALEAGSILTVFENYPGALTLGNLAAPTVQTLVVFHDPNCQFCAQFKTVTDTLANTGWKVIVLPVGILGENSAGYASVMYALAPSRPDVVEALYRQGVVGEATVESALDIAQSFGISAPQILSLISQTNAYETVTANGQLMDLLGAAGTPSWMISDYLYTGIVTSDDIQRVARDIPVPPGEVGFTRPGLDSPTIDPLLLPDSPLSSE
jgi:hypothetical protein